MAARESNKSSTLSADTRRTVRDLQIAKLYLQGSSQSEIGRQLGMLAGHVAAAIRRIVLLWKSETIFNVNEAKIIEIQHINMIERQAWESFHVSQRGGEIKDPTTGRITGYARLPGDKGWLNIAKDCVRARCEILGLFAPEKTESVVTVNEKFRTRDQMFAEIQGKLAALRPKLASALQASGYSGNGSNGSGHHHSGTSSTN